MNTHTPGPWAVNTQQRESLRIHHRGELLARIEQHKGNHEANARLIAAAPDLLCAMKELFEQCVMVHRYGGDRSNQKEADAAIKAGLAAIAKATEGEREERGEK